MTILPYEKTSTSLDSLQQTIVKNRSSSISPTPSPIPLLTPATAKTLPSDYHVFQTFNNCGPAALSMALSHYGITVSQEVLGRQLRPYQNSIGDNDDKSVTLAEIAEKSKEYELTPYHRPNGNIDLIKLFITYDMPVIVRTWTSVSEDIGHFRVIKGYDSALNIIIQDDSLQGKNLEYSVNEFSELWKSFNYEYVVLVPQDKDYLVPAMLKEDIDPKIAWQKAVELSLTELSKNPNNTDARFNLSVAYYNIGDYDKSVIEFEKIERSLTFRTLWYQIEPIEAYYKLGNYKRVFEITDKILNNHNRAFSELYMLRGNIYLGEGNVAMAKKEFEKAVMYNNNYQSKIPQID
jgi:tetratricopeptide (TPR) repeat protein